MSHPMEEWGLQSGRNSCRSAENRRHNFREYDFKAMERNVIEPVQELALAILGFRPSFCLESLIMCLFTTGLGHLNLSILLLETTSNVLLCKDLVKKSRVTLFFRYPGAVKLCRSFNNCAHEGEFWAFLAGFVFSI